MSALGEAQCKARLSPEARGAAWTQREGRVIVARHSFSDLGEGGLLGRKDRSFFAAGSRLRDTEVKSKGIKGKRVTQGRGGRSEKRDPDGPRVLREQEARTLAAEHRCVPTAAAGTRLGAQGGPLPLTQHHYIHIINCPAQCKGRQSRNQSRE